MELVMISLIATVVLAVVMSFLVKPNSSKGRLAIVGSATTLVGLFFTNAAIFQGVLFFIFSVVIRVFQPRRKAIVASLLLIALTANGLCYATKYSELRELHALRREYPVESVADRLEYEEQAAASLDANVLQVPLTPLAVARLEKLETEGTENMRRFFLGRLHSAKYEEFVVASGFGPVRMGRVRREKIVLPELAPAELPPRPQQVDPPTLVQGPLELAATGQHVDPSDLNSLHDGGILDFTNRERTGFVADRQKVAGFLPHAVFKIPSAEDQRAWIDWQVSHMELVSLLKHAEPRVYLSEHLPRMEELRNAETRPVDEFEQRALQQLRGGEDIVVDQQLNTIRMVGAVRAAKQCLDCHSVRRGELLGAFSYLLDRKQPLPPPKVEAKPVSMIWR